MCIQFVKRSAGCVCILLIQNSCMCYIFILVFHLLFNLHFLCMLCVKNLYLFVLVILYREWLFCIIQLLSILIS